MGRTAVNDQKNLVLGPHHEALEKFDENSGVNSAFFFDHEPHVAARRTWSAPQAAWTAVTADDGFGAFIQPYAPLPATLPQMCGQDPLAVERALELLEGPVGNVDEWYTLRELGALKVADEESIRSVTVSQETDAARHGVAFRRARARRPRRIATSS
jgi:hypothetical protein